MWKFDFPSSYNDIDFFRYEMTNINCFEDEISIHQIGA